MRDLWLLDMAPYYEALCKSLDWQMDVDLLSKMKKANEEELKRLDEELEDAEKNPKAIDTWIESISELHRSKPPATVHYTR